VNTPDDDQDCLEPHFETFRRVGDRYTWMIPFEIGKVHPSSTPDSVVEYSSFDLAINWCGEDYTDSYYDVRINTFQSHMLKHKYIYGARYLYSPSQFWRQYAGPLLDEKIHEELEKLPVTARPKDWEELMAQTARFHEVAMDFEKPNSWRYFDDQIPIWFRYWEHL
jgi:hypothetical protein